VYDEVNNYIKDGIENYRWFNPPFTSTPPPKTLTLKIALTLEPL